MKTGIFEPQRGYRGAPLKFLGETKAWSTDAVLDKILQQDATAPFIVRKLLTHFVTPMPADAYVARLAAGYRRSRYDTKALLRDILHEPRVHRRGHVPRAHQVADRADDPHREGARRPDASRASSPGQGQGMGQMLFDPPSVGGWPENESWVSSNTMLARANFVTSAVQAVQKLPSAGNAHNTQIDGVMSAQTLKLLNEAMDDRRRWMVLLASPEFQLK